MTAAIKVRQIRRWIEQSSTTSKEALGMAWAAELSAKDWERIGTLCRDAQRWLCKAKWLARTNAQRAKPR